MAEADGYRLDVLEYREWLWKETREGRPPKKGPILPHIYRFAEAQLTLRRIWRYRCDCCYDRGRQSIKAELAASLLSTFREGRVIAASHERIPGEWYRRRHKMPFNDSDDGPGDSRVLVSDDNEQARAPGFGFHHIVRQEPGYRIRYRAARGKRPPVKDCISEPDSQDREAWGGWEFVVTDKEASDADADSVWTGFYSDLGSETACGGEWLELNDDADGDGSVVIGSGRN